MKVPFSASIVYFLKNPNRVGVFIFLFSFFIFQLGFSNPTTCDTLTLNTEVKWRYFHQLTSFSQKGSFIDIENIKGFQHYEFPKKSSFFIATKGNIGHSTRNLEFSPKLSTGFNLYRVDPFFGNNFFKDELRFYEPEHVYTDLYYVSGPKREQTFNVLHNQRLSEGFVLGLNYRVLNSPGRYSRTAAANTNWYVNFNYNHPQRKYGAIGGLIINRVQNQESGGLKDRLLFEENRWSDGGVLSKAELRDREINLFVHQFIKTGIPNTTNTSLSEDTLVTQNNSNGGGRLFHDFSISRRSINFFDKSAPESSFYGIQPINNKETHDSTTVFLVENSLGLVGNLALNQNTDISLKVFAKHRFANIKQNVFSGKVGSGSEQIDEYDFLRNSFSQVFLGGEAELGLFKSASLGVEGNFVALGYNLGDFGIASVLSLDIPSKTSTLELYGQFHLQEAPYFLTRFVGNYVSWLNDFDKQRITNAGVGFKNDWLDLKANAYLLSNMVYLGAEAIPVQNKETFGLISFRGGLKKAFGPFNTGHEILLQYAGSDNFERFPLLTSYHTFFFEFSMFKQALYLNVGIDLYYNTPYKPMGFMPVIRQFFAQNTYQSDHIFTADFFATFRIDRARIFLKVHNIGSEIPQIPVVYQVPFYPIQDFAVKFGLSWPFFN